MPIIFNTFTGLEDLDINGDMRSKHIFISFIINVEIMSTLNKM